MSKQADQTHGCRLTSFPRRRRHRSCRRRRHRIRRRLRQIHRLRTRRPRIHRRPSRHRDAARPALDQRVAEHAGEQREHEGDQAPAKIASGTSVREQPTRARP